MATKQKGKKKESVILKWLLGYNRDPPIFEVIKQLVISDLLRLKIKIAFFKIDRLGKQCESLQKNYNRKYNTHRP